jgi:hypothetical protein
MAPAMMNVPASMRSGMMRCARRAVCDALHADGGCARALDLRAHGVEQRGEVGDFGLARAVLHHGFALGEDGGHQQVFGAGDGDLVEDDARALEPLGAGFDVAVFLRDLRAQAFQPLMCRSMGRRRWRIRRAGDARHAAAGDQRAEHERGGAHGLDQFVLGFGIGELARSRWWCGAGRVRSRVRPRRPWRRAACASVSMSRTWGMFSRMTVLR